MTGLTGFSGVGQLIGTRMPVNFTAPASSYSTTPQVGGEVVDGYVDGSTASGLGATFANTARVGIPAFATVACSEEAEAIMRNATTGAAAVLWTAIGISAGMLIYTAHKRQRVKTDALATMIRDLEWGLKKEVLTTSEYGPAVGRGFRLRDYMKRYKVGSEPIRQTVEQLRMYCGEAAGVADIRPALEASDELSVETLFHPEHSITYGDFKDMTGMRGRYASPLERALDQVGNFLYKNIKDPSIGTLMHLGQRRRLTMVLINEWNKVPVADRIRLIVEGGIKDSFIIPRSWVAANYHYHIGTAIVQTGRLADDGSLD